ncbi:hypothetical protein EV209_2244 [Cuneatibacter caecimuris]|uniref:Uncharacterized protein n=1 Tax=Cuneatibacter caecimuris TaxID=1796618 RepID=A0A4Q7P6R7_9FIRM|nr:hypothetical protein EV209_2244 [Cuneatibacter caecimuris]
MLTKEKIIRKNMCLDCLNRANRNRVKVKKSEVLVYFTPEICYYCGRPRHILRRLRRLSMWKMLFLRLPHEKYVNQAKKE